MTAFDTEEETLRCMRDCGCTNELAADFLESTKMGDQDRQLEILQNIRGSLLNELHKVQKELDCIDYLLREMEKQKERK